jgi:hypothetical protein
MLALASGMMKIGWFLNINIIDLNKD